MLSRDDVDAIAVRVVSVLNDVVAGAPVALPYVGTIDPQFAWPELAELLGNFGVSVSSSAAGPVKGASERQSVRGAFQLMPPADLASYVLDYANAVVAASNGEWSLRSISISAGLSYGIFFPLKRSAEGNRAFQYETAYRLIMFMRERFPSLDPLSQSEG